MGFCWRSLGAGQSRSRVPGAPPTAPPPARPHTFPAAGGALAGLLPPAPRLAPAALLADHPLQDAGGHRAPEVVCKDTRPRPLCLRRGRALGQRQPRSAPTPCSCRGVRSLAPASRPSGEPGAPHCPLAHTICPYLVLPPLQTGLTAGTSPAATHPPAHRPRGRIGHPLSCATRAVVQGHPHHLCLPSVLSPAQTDPSRSALCGQQRHSPPQRRGLPGSWVHSSKCRWPGVLRPPLSTKVAQGPPNSGLGPGLALGASHHSGIAAAGRRACSPPRLQTNA